MAYQSTNPCLCSSYSPPMNTPACNEDNCLKACNTIISINNVEYAKAPCGVNGSFDLSTLAHISTGCQDSVVYSLEYENGFFDSVSILSDGTLTWVTGDASTAGQYGDIYFKLTCNTTCTNCTKLEAFGLIQVGVKNLCANITCSEGQLCNSCNGLCEDIVDIEVGPNIADIEIS